jgi:ferredoxin-type protein NapG
MISRRELLLLWRRQAGVLPADRPDAGLPERPARLPDLQKRLLPLTYQYQETSDQEAWKGRALRPPGALPPGEFEAACTRCGKCVDACPAHAIQIASRGMEAGLPSIEPASSPCVLCSGLQCTRVCPSGALQLVAAPAAVRIGTAAIEPARCTAWRGLPCRICFDLCPIEGAITLTGGDHSYVPVVQDARCVGCGVCLHHCPAPGAIRIVPSAMAPNRQDGAAEPQRTPSLHGQAGG